MNRGQLFPLDDERSGDTHFAAVETLQKFVPINDSVTVAIEIPIWLTETDIAALEKQHGIELVPRLRAADRQDD